MAKTVLFVHGTGVRQKGFDATLGLIARQLGRRAPNIAVVGCNWGEAVGARLNRGGASIPTYGTTRGLGVSAEDEAEAMWSLLLQDPSFELALLAGSQAERRPLPPNATAARTEHLARLATLRTSGELVSALEAVALAAFWPEVLDVLEKSDGFRSVGTSPAAGTPAHLRAIARALVAALMQASLDLGGPTLDAATRDSLVRQIAIGLGDDNRGIAKAAVAPFKSLALSLATRKMRRARTSLMDASYPASGDILIYQAHGSRIRDQIRRAVEALPDDEVFILAHSLGGIAAFEMLVERPCPNVRALVTFGTQAPFLYEIGALQTLGGDAPLPQHVPDWHNFYDLNDPLSYVGEKLFEHRVSDHRVDSRASFPASHSAYLQSDAFWTVVVPLFGHA